MTDSRSPRLLRSIAKALGSSILIQAFVLVSGIAAARLLGPTDRGYLALIWTVSLTVSQLGSLGLPLAVTHAIASGHRTPSELFRDMRRSIAVQVIAVMLVHAACLTALVSFTATPSGAAWTSVLVMPAMLLQMFTLAVFQGAHDERALHRLRVLPVGLYAGALLTLAVVPEHSLLAVSLAWTLSYVVAAGFSLVAARPVLTAAPQASRTPLNTTERRDMRRFGYRSLLGWASPTETFRIDQLIVGLVLSAHSLGLYVAALAFTNLPRFIAQGIGLVAYPAVSRASTPGEKRAAIRRYVLLGGGISIVACGVLAVAAEILMSIAFGSSFTDAAGPLRVLLLGTAVLCVRRVLTDAVRGAGLETAGSQAEILSWFVLVPALFAGAPFGLYGVATAIVVSYVVSLGALSVLTVRGLGADWSGPTP
ncbi:MAG: oligosaccharide flippase family protein, partial [Patulibacter sp.]